MFDKGHFAFGRALCALMLVAAISWQLSAEEPMGEATALSPALPTATELLMAKLKALKKNLFELDTLTVEAEKELRKEQAFEKKAFDSNAYLSLSIKNTAPGNLYKLESTEIYFDNAKNPLAQGGKHNRGLPRKNELFFGAIAPGCHEITVKARYVRLKNDLISRFKVDRIEKIEAVQAFIATSGYRVELQIEGFEVHNTFANFFRGPAIRFNKSARPNFLPGAPIISMDDVLNQGRVQINYVTEDPSNHALATKSLSIDGLPILTDEKQDAKDGTVIFDAPLAPGEHRLSATLVFKEKKWVSGGPSYNFRLKFEQDFFVMSGQTTVIDLAGMPKDGIKSTLSETRYARSKTRILSKEYSEFFPSGRCPKEIAEVKDKSPKTSLEEQKAKVEPEKPAPPSSPEENKEPVNEPGRDNKAPEATAPSAGE